ncbi:hypothetical protein GJ496_009857 [Pomphorhynchus laevis]|nr:hypothetical protein GJ496_009857 [Pomphorhynchus laevis]
MSVTSQLQNETEVSHNGCEILDKYIVAYKECRHWKSNILWVPKYSAGSTFVDNLADMYKEASLETNESNNQKCHRVVYIQEIRNSKMIQIGLRDLSSFLFTNGRVSTTMRILRDGEIEHPVLQNNDVIDDMLVREKLEQLHPSKAVVSTEKFLKFL